MAALISRYLGTHPRAPSNKTVRQNLLSNTAGAPVNHPSRIFGASWGGGEFVENPIRILTNLCHDDPSPGAAADGWLALAVSDPPERCWEHGRESNPPFRQRLGPCRRCRVASDRLLPGSSGPHGGGLAPTSARAREECPRPMTRFAALEHLLAAPPKIPGISCVPPFNAPRPAPCDVGIFANLPGRAHWSAATRSAARGREPTPTA